MKIYVINGPNLNMLGIREPQIYGTVSFRQLCEKIEAYCEKLNIHLTLFQSNHEGSLVDCIQEAYLAGADGVVINPGAYTHTSIALLDAVKATAIPTVEVHISNPDEREEFRRVSYVRAACIATVAGKGIDGYLEAIDVLVKFISEKK